MKTKFKIIPAIDIIEGKCVRLTQGDYSRKIIYNENPIDVAKTFEDAGIQHLHLVDLDGAASQKIINYKILDEIAKSTNLIIEFGGGIKSEADLNIAFDCGANQVICGSISVTNPEIVSNWIIKYGSNKIILGADCQNKKVAINGWKKCSDLDIMSLIKQYENLGITNIICTDISKDGLLQGPSISLYREMKANIKAKLIASGGVSSIEDIIAIKKTGCDGVVIGKAIYENRITLQELSDLC